MTNPDRKSNRLINEKSPYLLQHAYNPVDWYPWCDEAFTKAKTEDKPIFLSIGYSTCHWCHVMEHESFEDPEVAEILNKHFISIKVDREERPDIDHIYMEVCQALNGHGGWPLTIIMTPDQKPFFAGTYFPKNDRMGIQGLMSILNAVVKAWETKRDDLLDSSRQIIEYIAGRKRECRGEISKDVADTAFSYFKQNFDPVYGGFGTAPKFPTPHNLMFLLRYWKSTGKKEALNMVERTLDSMYRGGIYDHIGFGFCRYSTDNKWLVPHFEKMLYDNALLAIAYLEAWQATKKDKYRFIARDILTYVLRTMTSPEGGFFCAEDADSEGIEGKFYVWSPDEIEKVLGEEDGKKFCQYYDITEKGNFEGKSIPNLIYSSLPYESIDEIKPVREKLFLYRENRVHPHKDDKILTSWNGLMIAAMAMAGRITEDDAFTEASKKAVEFIFNKLVRSDGRLLARYRDGESNYLAYAEDYAFLTFGLIELYETTYDTDYLKKALKLSDDLLNLFWDEKDGGLYVYGSDSEQLIMRPKEIYDGATPSANSVTALNFMRLSRLTGRNDLEDKANGIIKAFSDEIEGYPIAYAYALMAILFGRAEGQEIVITAESLNEAKLFINILNKDFRPFTTSLLVSGEGKELIEIAPFTDTYTTINGRVAAYVCENFSCKAPVTEIEEFLNLLK